MVKPSMVTSSPQNKGGKNGAAAEEPAPQPGRRNRLNFQRLHGTEKSFKGFTTQSLQLLRKPTGILSRAEKVMVRRRLALVAISLSTLAAVLAGFTNYAIVDSTPTRAVNTYMGALESGNYLRALGRSVYQDSSNVYLKNSMYRSGDGRVEDYRIISVEERGDKATALVEVIFGGQQKEVEIGLHRVTKTGIFNDVWELDREPQIYGMITAPLALDAVTINGRKLRLGAGTATENNGSGARWTMPLLPGNYTIDLPQDSYYTLAQELAVFSVPLKDPHNLGVDLALRPSTRMWQETNDAINSWLETCTSSRSLAPRDCPASTLFEDDGTPLTEEEEHRATPTPTSRPSAYSYRVKIVEVSDVEWELIETPNLALEQVEGDFSRWQANPATSATYRLTYAVDGKKYQEIIPFSIRAEVESTGSQASIDVGLMKQGNGEAGQEASSSATASPTPQPSE